MMRNRAIDFNSVLMGANGLIAILLVFAFTRLGGNEYVDGETMVLGMALSVQTHIALWFEKRRRDPFVILLTLSMTFYYLLRLLTLTWYPFSTVFERYPYNPGDTNYALIFILVSNLFLYAGFYIGNVTGDLAIKAGLWKATSPVRVVFLMLVAIIFAYFSGDYWNEDNVPSVFNFLTIFVAQDIVLLMALAYYFVFKQSLSRKVGIVIAVMIAVDIVVHTLMGSRGGIVSTVQNYIWVALAIGGCLQIGRKYLVLGLLLFPVVVILLIGSFAISTYNRAFRDAGTLDVSRAFDLALESSSELSVASTLDKVVPLIADRVGYFDYSAEIIAHEDKYASVLNLSTYAKSIVDNILTPGFDVYDQPKISNALQFVYTEMGFPSKERVNESYHSDQLGIYGEFYALFGYASLPIFLLIAFLMKRIYGRMRSENPFILVMKRVVVLFVFVRALDSYGLDWTILEALPRIAAIYIYRFCFRSRLASAGEFRSREELCRPISGSSIAPASAIAANGHDIAL
jgi:hypothetical protein